MRKRTALLGLVPLLAACTETNPTNPALEARVFSVLGGLDVGQALTLSGEDALNVFLSGGRQGNEYIYVPFLAADTGTVRLKIDVTGERIGQAATSNASRVPLPTAEGAARRARDDFHLRWLESQRSVASDVLRRASRAGGPELLRRSFSRARLPGAAAAAVLPPAVGDVIPLRTPNTGSNGCVNPTLTSGRVVAVSAHSIVVADTRNPADLSATFYQQVADDFEQLVWPTDTRNFGAPTDVDVNERVILFFTRFVNELTPPGANFVVGGLTFPLDMLPREIHEQGFDFSCPASNEAEIFYLLAPDPQGEINGHVRTPLSVERNAVGVTGHEFEHLINFGRRFYLVPNAQELEEVWLDEGLAHMAEELIFYAATGLQPRGNLAAGQLTGDQLDPYYHFQIDNILRYATYLETPDEQSLMAQDDELATRGATWAFLRYAADQEPGDDAAFFSALVNSPIAGVANLRRALGRDPKPMMQAWTVSSFTDDHVEAIDSVYMQPSWNYRSIMANSTLTAGLYDAFPLDVHLLRSDGKFTVQLQGGGAAYVRVLGQSAHQAAVSVTAANPTVAANNFRLSVVRVR